MIAILPLALGEAFLFCTILYFMSGLVAEASRYFFYVLCGFCSTMFMGNVFRTFAYLSPNLQAAMGVPMPIIAVLIVFAGFMITQSHMGWLLFMVKLFDFFCL